MKILLIIFAVLFIVFLVLTSIGVNVGTSLPEGYSFGVKDGKLAPCKDSPNCVCSQAETADKIHYIEPIKISGQADEAMKKIIGIINSMPRSKIIEQKPDYVRAEFRSKTFKFVDDVEFYLDKSAGVIHARSAARTGKGDLGVNRKRVEAIRAKYESASGT